MSSNIPLTRNEGEHSTRIGPTPPGGNSALGNKDADAFQFAFYVSSVLCGLVVTVQDGLKPCMLPGAPYHPLILPSSLIRARLNSMNWPLQLSAEDAYHVL